METTVFIIVLVALWVFLIAGFSVTLRAIKETQDKVNANHQKVHREIHMMRYITLMRMREFYERQEQYERARDVTEILDREFKDIPH